MPTEAKLSLLWAEGVTNPSPSPCADRTAAGHQRPRQPRLLCCGCVSEAAVNSEKSSLQTRTSPEHQSPVQGLDCSFGSPSAHGPGPPRPQAGLWEVVGGLAWGDSGWYRCASRKGARRHGRPGLGTPHRSHHVFPVCGEGPRHRVYGHSVISVEHFITASGYGVHGGLPGPPLRLTGEMKHGTPESEAAFRSPLNEVTS